ncbi:MAG: ABC transporter ATP-binding protein [Bacteroidia bacterium]
MSQLLQIKELSHQFGDLLVLDNITFDLGPQSCLAVVGSNGAGKSTLLNCISGFYAPSRGTLRFKGQSLRGKRTDQIARLGISRTFQQPQLFIGLSVRQHLELAQFSVSRPRRTLGLIDQYLQDCALDKLAERLPESLSFGQQKTLAIARCLATQPQLIMLDEPAAGLSESEKDTLIKLLQGLQQKYQFSILLVEHQQSLIEQLADQVLVL